MRRPQPHIFGQDAPCWGSAAAIVSLGFISQFPVRWLIITNKRDAKPYSNYVASEYCGSRFLKGRKLGC